MKRDFQTVLLMCLSFNFTNTPAFGNPNTAVGTVNAGQINSAGDPRRIQFALKYVF